MKDKRYLVLGQYDSGLYCASLPLLESFDTAEEALSLFEQCKNKAYDWVTIYDRVEGEIIKEY